MASTVWFTTGTSKGFGRVWAEAALAQGDRGSQRVGSARADRTNLFGALRLFFRSGGLNMTRAEYARRIETWEKWNLVSMEAQGDWPSKHKH